MVLATDSVNFADGNLGMVELALSYLNDRQKKQWSKAEIIEYINQAQLELADAMNSFHKEYFLTNATTPIIGDQQFYSLPTDLQKLIGVEIVSDSADREPRDLVSIPFGTRQFYETLDQANQKQDYQFYFVAGTELKMLPESGTTTGELMRVWYVKRLTRLVDNADVSEIPENGQEIMVYDAAIRALAKLGRVNEAIERLRDKKNQAFFKAIAKYLPQDEEFVEPFRGTFGPVFRGSKDII